MLSKSLMFAAAWQDQAYHDARRARCEPHFADNSCALDIGPEHSAMWQKFAAVDTKKAHRYMGITEEDQFYA